MRRLDGGQSAAMIPATPESANAVRISRHAGMKKRYPAGRLGDCEDVVEIAGEKPGQD
jgi:hypothetical protein